VDWVGSRTVRKQSTFDRPPSRARDGALFKAGEDGAVYGDSPHMVLNSAYTKATIDPAVGGAVLAVVGLAGAALLSRRGRG